MKLQWSSLTVIMTLATGGGVEFAQGATPATGGVLIQGVGGGGGGMGFDPSAVANATSPYSGAPFSIGGAGSSYATSSAISTSPGEGFGRGVSELIRAAGSYNVASSEAAVNLTEAERRQLKNDVDFVNTYFQIRRLNQQLRAQARGPRPTMDDLVRFAQLGKPQRLSPGDIDAASGQIFWPVILRAQVFAPYRIKLETYFNERTQLGGIGPENYLRLDQAARAMIEELRRYVADFPPGDYVHAKHFVESLGYEAHFPVGQQPVAATAASNNAVSADQVR